MYRMDYRQMLDDHLDSNADVTIAVKPCSEEEIAGFGELFRMLSYEHIGTSTIQSRACAGVARGTYLFALPGSTGACKDAWDGILRYQLDIRYKPCNFAELIPLTLNGKTLDDLGQLFQAYLE